MRELITIQEAADLVGVHSRTITRKIKAGHLKGYRIKGGRSLRILKDDLITLFNPITWDSN